MLDREIFRCNEHKGSFALVIGDIDDFKRINDSLGHQAGDYILVEIARVMSRSLRRNDLLARWGGEEFLLLLPDTDLASGAVVAEKIRERIENASFTWENRHVNVTMTLGVGLFHGGCDFESVLQQADGALIDGKKRGKNCVVIAAEIEPVPAVVA